MSLTKDFYWDQISNEQTEAKLAEDLDKMYQAQLEDDLFYEDMSERQKFFDIFDLTNTYPI